MEKPFPEMIAQARQNALNARKVSLGQSDEKLKLDWATIAALWETVAEGYERLRDRRVK